MEPIALQVKPMQFDALGAVKQGMELANLGIQPLRLAQELRQAQIAERQALIQEKEAQRALDMRLYEDNARKSIGEIMRRHTKKDARGRTVVDHDAALAEARASGLDPSFTTELESKVLANRASGLKTGTDADNFLKDTFNDAAVVMRGMSDAQAAEYLDGRVKMIARATGIPEELVQDSAVRMFNYKPGSSLSKNAEAIVTAQTISPAQEVQNKFTETQLKQAWESITQAGVAALTGPEARNRNSAVTKSARVLAINSLGPKADPAEVARINQMSAAEIANLPGMREVLTSNVRPASDRGAQAAGAVEANIQAQFFGKLERAAMKVARGRKAPELTPANIIANKFNQALLDDPDVREYVTLIQEANAKGIPIPQDAAGPSSVAQIARGQQQLKRGEATERGGAAGSARFTETPTAAPTPAPTTRKAGAGEVLVRRKSDGKVAAMPRDRARAAIATGRFEEAR